MRIKIDKSTTWSILYWSAFILADVFIYLFWGLMQMNYDDHYNETKGIYGSWESMSSNEQTYHAVFLLWNLINLIILGLLIRKIVIKRFKKIRAES